MSMFKENIPDRLLDDLSRLNWYRHGIYRDNVLFRSGFIPFLGDEWFTKEGVEKGINHQIGLGEQAFLVEEETDELTEMMYRKIDANFLGEYIRNYDEDNENIIKISEQIMSKDFVNMTDKELKISLEHFFDESKKLYHWLWSMEFLNTALDRYLRERIRLWKPDWDEEEINDFIILISYTPHKIAFQREKEDILRGEKFKDIYQKYSWISMNVWDGRPFSPEEYKERAAKILADKENIRRVQGEYDAHARKAQEVMQNINNNEIKEILSITQRLIFLKTERIDFFSRSWSIMMPLIDEVCKRLGISYTELLKLTQPEILDSLEAGKLVFEDFTSRDKYTILRLNNEMHHFCGDAHDKIEEVLFGEDFSHIKEIRGNTAYKGVVIGKAKVLMNDRELHKLEKGDIMICNITNPNYDLAFEKIKGLVTDDGGLLCHSAIMAREFKIPCVVGTKIATRVFKDDDLLELDAEKGIIRKI